MVTKIWSGEEHTKYKTLDVAYEEIKIDLTHLHITNVLGE
jgi:hypothetical protein